MYAAATKTVTRRVGLAAAALTACNPFLVWYSQEFRPYELLVALSAAGLLAFAYARESRRSLAAWAIVSALALADHYYALLLVVPEAVWLLIAHRYGRKGEVAIAIGFVGACGLALLPLAISQNSSGNASWIAPIPLMPRLGQIVPPFLIGFQAPAQQVLERVAEAAVIVALVLLTLRADRRERAGALMMGVLAVGGFALNLALIAGGIDDLITRNLLALWSRRRSSSPAAWARSERAGWESGPPPSCAQPGSSPSPASPSIAPSSVRTGERPGGRSEPIRLRASASARSSSQRYRDLLPLSLYLPGLKSVGDAGARVSELDVVSIRAPRVPLCGWGAPCNLSGSRMQRTYAIPGFHFAWRRRALQFTVLRLVSSRPRRVTPAIVAAALRTSPYRRDELLVQRR